VVVERLPEGVVIVDRERIGDLHLLHCAASVEEQKMCEWMRAKRRYVAATTCRLLLQESTLGGHRHCLSARVHP